MRFAALVLGVLAGAGAGLLALRRLDAVEVSGSSMAPALHPGDRLLVESLTFAVRSPRPGDVVLAADPRQPERELIKRVAGAGSGVLQLRGDHPAASTDSRTFGSVPVDAVRWRVLLRYWPPLRIGPVEAPSVGLAERAADRGQPLVEVDEGGEAACAAFGDLVVGAD